MFVCGDWGELRTKLTNAMFCEPDEDLSLRSGVSLQQVSPLLISQCGHYKLKLEVSPVPVPLLVVSYKYNNVLEGRKISQKTGFDNKKNSTECNSIIF